MRTVIIVLALGLILCAVYGLIVYAARRSLHKSAFKDFRDTPVSRGLGDEEKSALKPILRGLGFTVEDDAGSGAVASMASDPDARSRRGEVVILNQRVETPEEVESRMGRASGWGSALVWLLAFALLWLTTRDAMRAVQAYLLGAGLLAGLCAAWLRVRRPSGASAERRPQQVNHVRGVLHAMAVVDTGQGTIRRAGPLIGDRLGLALPSHWARAPSMPYGEVIEAELRANDCSAVRFGRGWSVADEWRRFRPVYWGAPSAAVAGRAACAAGVGAVAPRFARRSAARPGGVVQSVFHAQGGAYADATRLAAELPPWSSLVSLRGEGRCEIDRGRQGDDTRTAPTVDCTRVRWNGQAAVVPDLQIADSIVALGRPDFIRASDSSVTGRLMAMLGLRMDAGADPLAVARAREQVPMFVRDFDRSVAIVDAACQDAEGLASGSCRKLQQAIVNAVEATDDTDTPIRTWSALAASAAPDRENAALVLTRGQLTTLQRAVRASVDGLVGEKIAAARPAIVPARGGVLLVSTSPIVAVQPPAGQDDAARQAGQEDTLSSTDDDDASDDGLLARWARLQRNAAPEGVMPFALAGLVTARGLDDTGAVRLQIDPHRDAAQLTAAGARMLWCVFALALVWVHGPLWALRLAQSLRRRSRLRADIAARPAPGAASLF